MLIFILSYSISRSILQRHAPTASCLQPLDLFHQRIHQFFLRYFTQHLAFSVYQALAIPAGDSHIGRSSFFLGTVDAYLASPQGRRFREVEE